MRLPGGAWSAAGFDLAQQGLLAPPPDHSNPLIECCPQLAQVPAILPEIVLPHTRRTSGKDYGRVAGG
ncbi:MAG TPA: hypothetical protein VHJ69_08090, partial [Gemmatimonadales bacterium]|nr:hypothetical protein [Gemmatimonadales bacterium]